MSATAPVALVGRESETELLAGLLERIRDQGGALVVRGEAGIGKSALLTEAGRVAAARGLRVLTAAGAESEVQLAFAGLHRLLRPLLAYVDELPGPQSEAILAAFATGEAGASDFFLIALATLNLAAAAAARAPVLLIVEDAHWLDRASADVLLFVARRLTFEPIVLLAAVRDGFESSMDNTGLPELPLKRLDDAASATLLDSRFPDLRPPVRARILGEAGGNPLALVELPVTVAGTGAAEALPAWLPLTTRLERAFAERVSGLSVATRTLLLVAALNDGDTLAETLAAGALVAGEQLSLDDLAPALAVHLVDTTGERLRFRHPLMRSAIRQRSTIGQRQRVHAALARVLAEDSDRGVWHAAAASLGPDEVIAAELEAVATRAQRRGATTEAVAALEHAGRLSEDPGRRRERMLRAAECAVELGRPDVVVRLLHEAGPDEVSERHRARRMLIGGGFDDGIRDANDGAVVLAEAATRVAADGDVALALRLLWGAALRCFWAQPGPEASARVVAAAEALPVDELDAQLLAIFAFAAPIERGRVVIDRMRRSAASWNGDAQTARMLGDAALLVGAWDLALQFCTAALPELRARGRLGLLARALGAQAWSAVRLVDLGVAIPAAEEASLLAQETAQPLMYATAQSAAALLAAVRGDEDRLAEVAAEAERVAIPVDAHPVLATVQLARGLAALGDGRHDHAYEQLRRMHDPADPAYHAGLRCHAVGELVEAAVYSGQGDAVRPIVAEMEEIARATPAAALHIDLRYARALLAADADAEPLFLAAQNAELVPWPFARARAQLAYGAWLRRQRRAADSRAPLRTARETFDALGAVPWSERARQELRASGEVSRGRAPDARDQLSARELQIAQMVAQNLTNKEIAQRLYVSHRTVSSHLHRIFPKLGVTSRSALRAALEPTA
ncbi:AAA family ATPase [Frankia sp. AgB1.9]|uniref:helix-turn-helix transcriptional regulator n=1 Tax=unclassified Frankia TaxID=2632575 RepID=UPI001931A869|nr:MULTISPECIES: LuxR family transcriptional regulator [unclassified Frankia]MBL7488653.1 AAA family ATPase [Frankia sp. AgW1.1]MBL7551773.1 AAA family ATPase [Frankia sp. AgB1.9]MBL7621094.1 AAA family ATPase [Frankia sp. AgB1.8]